MRLIDADALFKDVCDSINEMTKIGICVDGEWLWAKLNDALENAPTIEPERKKGNWVGIDDEPCDDWECDRCGEIVTDCFYDGLPNFCPNCGADMREGET